MVSILDGAQRRRTNAIREAAESNSAKILISHSPANKELKSNMIMFSMATFTMPLV